MSTRSALGLLAVLGASTLLSGCLLSPFSFDRDRDDPDFIGPTPEQPQQPVARAPSVDAIEIADWPPVGPKTMVLAKLRDPDANLSAVRFEFKHDVMRAVSGGSAAIGVTGDELGEGFGMLSVTAFDTTGAFAQRDVNDMLVDLSPPKIELGQTVVAADGVLELWVGDAWVLGSVELSFAGQSQAKVFDPGYPTTVGHTWDFSLVKFAMSALPAIAGQAAIVATDAAGNSVVETFQLVIDGEPPNVAITSPAEGSTVSGTLTVDLTAGDPGGGPVWIDLLVNATPVATATAPQATLSIDTAELVPGSATLTAVARDQAGNQTTVSRQITIE